MLLLDEPMAGMGAKMSSGNLAVDPRIVKNRHCAMVET